MSSVVRLFIALVALEVSLSGVALAADQTEFELFYSSKLIGEPATLEIGPNKRHLMRTFELTAMEGTSLAGATTALCHQNKEEDTSLPGGFSYDAFCTWRDIDSDLIFETYNGGAGPDDTGHVTFGSGLLVGGTGKFDGITGGFGWSNDGQKGRKRGLYYLPGG
jgi:hypothetical protein